MPIYSKSYKHVHDASEPRCGLPTPAGDCLWSREPGLPYCNGHVSAFFARLAARGMRPETLPDIPLPDKLTMERLREGFGQYLAHVEEMRQRTQPKEQGA